MSFNPVTDKSPTTGAEGQASIEREDAAVQTTGEGLATTPRGTHVLIPVPPTEQGGKESDPQVVSSLVQSEQDARQSIEEQSASGASGLQKAADSVKNRLQSEQKRIRDRLAEQAQRKLQREKDQVEREVKCFDPNELGQPEKKAWDKALAEHLTKYPLQSGETRKVVVERDGKSWNIQDWGWLCDYIAHHRIQNPSFGPEGALGRDLVPDPSAYGKNMAVSGICLYTTKPQ